MDKYTHVETIGEGRFGVVYKCHDRVTGKTVAIKKIYFKNRYEGVPCSIIREVSLLKEMEHDNIIRLLDVMASEDRVSLVFEYMDIDLLNFMRTHPSIAKNPRITKKFLYQILCGVAYCHSHKVLHRDLKPQNLLIDLRKNIVKLADFGLARETGVPLKTYSCKVGTLQYAAPEILLGCENYSSAVDVWSVGCIFAQMVNNQKLFYGHNKKDQLFTTFSLLGSPNEETLPGVTSFYSSHGNSPKSKPEDLAMHVPGLEPAGVDLLSKMLCLNPSKRITAHDALQHPYFRDVQAGG